MDPDIEIGPDDIARMLLLGCDLSESELTRDELGEAMAWMVKAVVDGTLPRESLDYIEWDTLPGGWKARMNARVTDALLQAKTPEERP